MPKKTVFPSVKNHVLGPEGRTFKSCRPDYVEKRRFSYSRYRILDLPLDGRACGVFKVAKTVDTVLASEEKDRGAAKHCGCGE
ncbi:hypothetical protein Pan14r_16480 [Crateriforma conspicua]|uniref:Uncharacterized protein n=1 Tax=Crateriforma conspicua TaxID=2527996 RepID=A0A5C5Y7N0_9PLAN|nr:hypothetical protein Pan14r_16480 [Crateriforma conspicua]